MEIREIATFIQVAQQKNFSRAAKQLGYSQAAVTIQIKQLENELGVRLFDRIGKQINLTHQGVTFYEYAVAILKNVESAKDAVVTPRELSGRLCIGAIESVCSFALPALIKQYHSLYPAVNINIITGSPADLLHMMDGNMVDLVYFLDKRMYNPKWIKELEEPEDIVFVASTSHPLAGRENLDLLEVLSHPFILTEKNASYRFMLDQYLNARNLEIKPFLEIGNTEFIISLLHDNLGISFLPRFIIQRDLDKHHLTTLNVDDFYMRIWRQIVYHKDKWVTKEMSAFLELVKTSPPAAPSRPETDSSAASK